MQNLFLDKNTEEFKKNLDIYFENLNEIIDKLDIEVDYILTMPYWIYEKDKNNKNFFVNSNLEDKLKSLVCRTFQKNKNLHNKYISILNDNNGILTEDKRHIRLDKLALTDLANYCKF